jgi:signal transduction histidine kinase
VGEGVLNLVSNAFKFTFEGEIEISLREAHAVVELTVRDTGTGIPVEELPRLFERFHRVKGARGRSYEGSGIGLALVQELVKLHGGGIRVESEVGRGSRFIVSIPFGKSHLPAERIGAGQTRASTGLRSDAYVEEVMHLVARCAASWTACR